MKAYKAVFENNDTVNPGIDDGIWYDRKKKAHTHDHHLKVGTFAFFSVLSPCKIKKKN